MNSNIDNYLSQKKNKNQISITSIDDISEKEDLMYVYINLKDRKHLNKVLSCLYYKLDDGAVIHLNNWFVDISDDDSVYQVFNKWKNNLKYKELIDFPLDNYNEKAYIVNEIDDYDNWSDV